VRSLVDGSRWAALTVTALLITACGDGGTAGTTEPVVKKAAESKPKPKATPAPTDTELLGALIANRAKALHLNDVDGYAGTATGAQVRRDSRAAQAAKALPIERLDMEVKATEVNGDRATLRVDTIYSFEGIDTAYFKTSRMTALKTPDGWRIRHDRPSGGVLAPWEYTRYKARKSPHFLALAPARMKVGSLMKDLEKGRARMARALPSVKPPKRTLVIVARNSKDAKALTKDLRTLRSLVAVAEAQYSFEGPAKRVDVVSGQRVFVMWRSYGNRSADERRTIIAHEMTHAALAARTGGRTPAWLAEGIALYASGDKRAGDAGAILSGAELRDGSKQDNAERALSLTRLAKPTALDKMDPVGLTFAYSYSAAAAYTIVQKHGVKGLLRLYSGFNSEKVKGKPGAKLTDKVMRRTLKKSLKTLESEIEAYARANSSV
jgi:hypothetical protein